MKVETNESTTLDYYQRRCYYKHLRRKILTQLRPCGKLLVHADSGPHQIGTRLTDDRHLYLITRICLSVLETFTATLETQHRSSSSLIFTANLVSKPLTMAPMALALPAAANPATPPPMISTCAPTHQDSYTNKNASFHKTETHPNKLAFAGGTFPAAVICPVKKRPKLLAASTTALYLRGQTERRK